MSGFIEGVDRCQATLFPDRLEDWICEDNPIRVIDLFVDEIDLEQMGFLRTAPARTGRPGYHPSVLLKLFIYGYLNRVPSSRALEREAGRNVEVMWLTGRLAPDHKTIPDFRSENGPAIRRNCAQFVQLCRRVGVLKGDCVAIDGSNFKAINNRDKNFTKGKIKSRTAHLVASIQRYLDDMTRIDRQEEGEVRAEKIANLAQRCERIRQEIARLVDMREALEQSPVSQISLTDPDSRSMATSARGSGFVGYNAQSAVDTETHLIVAHDVINAGHDRDQLALMAKAAKVALGRDAMNVVADKGYFSGREILACDEDGIITTLPRPETSGNRKKGRYVKADFAYDASADVYRCPADETLSYRYTTEESGLAVRRYWTTSCLNCPMKARCTTGRERRISRWEHEQLVDEMQERINDNPNLMSLRRSTVEHPFGTIKAWMGATHFRMRRLKNVRTEMAFHVLAYNIKRMISLVGVRGLLAAIPA
ncbi:MAG: IS1182 family transposase [Pseudomonadota bacterium]